MSTHYGLARVLSKLGFCSRSQGEALVRAGQVSWDNVVQRNPEFPALLDASRIRVHDANMEARAACYVMLNKPRGLITTRADERGRDTVYRCLEGSQLPWLGAVGRLDRASEGLLLLSNDTVWAAGISEAKQAVLKRYHVQVDRILSDAQLEALRAGVEVDGERLSVRQLQVLRTGQKNSWLEIGLEEGRNRHIRRLLEAHEIAVLRLIRVAIGTLALGDLAKGAWRHLRPEEVDALRAKNR